MIEKYVALMKDVDVIKTVPKTALDVFRMLPEGTLCDVIDNVLYMTKPPKYGHQRLLGLLAIKLLDHVEKHQIGEVIIYPFDIYLEPLLSAVQPDLTFVSTENMGILKKDGYIHGAPDLIVEVLSDDQEKDKVKKKSLYERAGVKEYFIVDPKSRSVQCHVLKNSRYEMAYDGEGMFKSDLLGLTFHF